MPWYLEAMKGVVGCVKRWRGANNRLPSDSRMGKPILEKFRILRIFLCAEGQPGEVKHLSNPRKRYSDSSGERNWNSPNRAACSSGQALCSRCSGVQLNPTCHADCEVTKSWDNRIFLERETIGGDSPVDKISRSSLTEFPSTAGHVKSCRNLS
jgi:hypothetical protein